MNVIDNLLDMPLVTLDELEKMHFYPQSVRIGRSQPQRAGRALVCTLCIQCRQGVQTAVALSTRIDAAVGGVERGSNGPPRLVQTFAQHR